MAERNLTPADFKVPGVDRRDECYKKHDRCVHDALNGIPCGNGTGDVRPCDHALARCLRSIPPSDPSFWGIPTAWDEAYYFDLIIPNTVHRK